MKTAILAAILLVGCGFKAPDADVISRRGVVSFGGVNSGLTEKYADKMEDYLLSALMDYGYANYESENAINGLQVHWVGQPFRCAGFKDETCFGETDVITHNVNLSDSPFSCPWLSAYVHEELHMIQWAKGLPVDYGHKRPEWKVVDDRQNHCY